MSHRQGCAALTVAVNALASAPNGSRAPPAVHASAARRRRAKARVSISNHGATSSSALYKEKITLQGHVWDECVGTGARQHSLSGVADKVVACDGAALFP